MAVQYKGFVYDYRVENKEFDKWLEKKEEDGWVFVCIPPGNYLGTQWEYILQVIFKKTV